MTEYEMASLANEYLTTGLLFFSSYFSLVSAFLLVAYVVAHRLTRTMVATVVGIFSIACVMLTLTLYRLLEDWTGVRHQISDYAQAGKGLAWHSAAKFTPSGFALYIAPTLWIMVAIGAVYFFFHCRRVNRKAETVVETPKV